ncbi:MAG: hypothetical protein P4M13_00215 [Alphaproteobacteria bacterium]|nr:hypothetical protein [Alphaproteobacteria bacterium]
MTRDADRHRSSCASISFATVRFPANEIRRSVSALQWRQDIDFAIFGWFGEGRLPWSKHGARTLFAAIIHNNNKLWDFIRRHG